MAKVLNCSLEVREFELQSRYYVDIGTYTLGKSMNLLTEPLLWVKLYPFSKDGFGIKITYKNRYMIKQRNQTLHIYNLNVHRANIP